MSLIQSYISKSYVLSFTIIIKCQFFALFVLEIIDTFILFSHVSWYVHCLIPLSMTIMKVLLKSFWLKCTKTLK